MTAGCVLTFLGGASVVLAGVWSAILVAGLGDCTLQQTNGDEKKKNDRRRPFAIAETIRVCAELHQKSILVFQSLPPSIFDQFLLIGRCLSCRSGLGELRGSFLAFLRFASRKSRHATHLHLRSGDATCVQACKRATMHDERTDRDTGEGRERARGTVTSGAHLFPPLSSSFCSLRSPTSTYPRALSSRFPALLLSSPLVRPLSLSLLLPRPHFGALPLFLSFSVVCESKHRQHQHVKHAASAKWVGCTPEASCIPQAAGGAMRLVECSKLTLFPLSLFRLFSFRLAFYVLSFFCLDVCLSSPLSVLTFAAVLNNNSSSS